VGFFDTVAPEMAEAMRTAEQALRDKLAGQERAARKTQQQAVVDATRQEYQEVLRQANRAYAAYKGRGQRVPEGLYTVLCNAPSFGGIGRCPHYQRAGAFLRWYRSSTQRLKQILATLPEAIQAEARRPSPG
jgi:hypothetical protein